MEPTPDSAAAVTLPVTQAVTPGSDCNATPKNQDSKPATDWTAIRSAWCNGEGSVTLAARHGISAQAIRVRASRQKWARGVEKAVKAGAAKAVHRVVRQHVARIKGEIEAQASAAIAECVAASVNGARRLVTVANDRIEGASNRDLSSVSTALRTGVTVWREALGLGSAGEGNGGLTINAHSVQLAVEERFAEPDLPPVVDV